MTKTKKIILGAFGLYFVFCLACAAVYFYNEVRDNKPQAELTQEAPDFSTVDPIGAQNIIGRWKLISELAPQLNATLVFFERNDSTLCLETYDKGGSHTIALRKDGNKYYDMGSTFGEYFLITGNRLQLFDNDGEYGGGTGYTITSLE